jgi:hypothetical protein
MTTLNEAAERLRDTMAPEDAPPMGIERPFAAGWNDGWLSVHDKIEQSLDAALARHESAGEGEG